MVQFLIEESQEFDRIPGDQNLKDILESHKLWLLGREGGIRADLRYMNLSQCDFSYSALCYARISNADLRGSTMIGADLRGAELDYADLTGAFIGKSNLRNANLDNADCTDAVLRDVDASGVSLRNTLLDGAVLQDVFMLGCSLAHQDLKSCKKHDIFFSRSITGVLSDLYANLVSHQRWLDSAGQQGERAVLDGQDLSYCDLDGFALDFASLCGANFTGSLMKEVNLFFTDLSGANLTNASLCSSRMSAVRLDYAILTQADLSDMRAGPLSLPNDQLESWLEKFYTLAEAAHVPIGAQPASAWRGSRLEKTLMANAYLNGFDRQSSIFNKAYVASAVILPPQHFLLQKGLDAQITG